MIVRWDVREEGSIDFTGKSAALPRVDRKRAGTHSKIYFDPLSPREGMDTWEPRLRVGHMTAEEMSRTSRALLWASLSEGIVVWFQYVKEGT